MFMDALSAAELDLHERVARKLRQEQKQALTAEHQQLQRLRYQAQLAERQFNQSDPDNRLVTAELEKRWEAALAALRQAEQSSAADLPATASLALDPPLRRTLEKIGQRLPQSWPQLSCARQKQLLRCLIDKVVLHRSPGDSVQVRVVWRGGDFSRAAVPVPVRTLQQLSQFEQMQQEVLRLSAAGQGDGQAAKRLTQAGFRSPSCRTVLPSTVRQIRLRHGILLHPGQSRRRQVKGYLTVTQLAKKLGILSHWIYDRIHSGVIQVHKDDDSRTYLIPDNPKTLKQFRQLLAGELKSLRI
jgi:hypothetical protein